MSLAMPASSSEGPSTEDTLDLDPTGCTEASGCFEAFKFLLWSLKLGVTGGGNLIDVSSRLLSTGAPFPS
jgi:hypothetical protein